jgi:hypothetical protein
MEQSPELRNALQRRPVAVMVAVDNSSAMSHTENNLTPLQENIDHYKI